MANKLQDLTNKFSAQYVSDVINGHNPHGTGRYGGIAPSSPARVEEVNFALLTFFTDERIKQFVRAYKKPVSIIVFGHEELMLDPQHSMAVDWINGDGTDQAYMPVTVSRGQLWYGGSIPDMHLAARILTLCDEKDALTNKTIAEKVLVALNKARTEIGDQTAKLDSFFV